MRDSIGTLTAAASLIIMIGVLVSRSAATVTEKWVVSIGIGLWSGFVVAVAAAGGFAPRAGSSLPTPALAAAFLIILLFGGWFLLPGFRSALLSLPLSTLVSLNVMRLEGLLFLILAAQGRLSAPFATSAGWGDVLTGALAIPLAVMIYRNAGRARTPLVLWNAFGTLDLLAAICLGVLSAPGTPFRVFTEEPGTTALGQMPWIMVPSILVPIYLLIHFTIAMKLRRQHNLIATPAMAH